MIRGFDKKRSIAFVQVSPDNSELAIDFDQDKLVNRKGIDGDQSCSLRKTQYLIVTSFELWLNHLSPRFFQIFLFHLARRRCLAHHHLDNSFVQILSCLPRRCFSHQGYCLLQSSCGTAHLLAGTKVPHWPLLQNKVPQQT